MSAKWWFFFAVVVFGVALDYWTKQLALAELQYGVTRLEWGGSLKLTLSFNRGAAFGMSLGSASRPIFIVFTIVTLAWLIWVYAHSGAQQNLRRFGIAFVCAGAVGNLIDRVTSAEGVVDFLGPYDLGFMIWPIFNVADIFVVIGIAVLLLSLRGGGLHEDVDRRAAADGGVDVARPSAVTHPEAAARTREDPDSGNEPRWTTARNSEGTP